MTLRSLLLAAAAIAAGCAHDRRTRHALVERVVLRAEWTTFRSDTGLSASSDEHMVCFVLQPDDSLRRDWRIATTGDRAAQPRAELVLSDSSVVALDQRLMLGIDYCRSTGQRGPLPARVASVRFAASDSLQVRGVYWLSTEK
jgi:hypothetical protein